MSLILDGTTGVPVTTVTGTLPVANGGTGGSTPVDGFKNRIINGAMGFWQRGTSFTGITNAPIYGADRWVGFVGAAVAGEQLVRSSSVPTGTGFLYSSAFGRTAANTNTNQVWFNQLIESVNMRDLAGQAVTLSFWAKTGTNYSGGTMTVRVSSGTSADESINTYSGGPASGYTGWVAVIGTTQSLTATWTQYSFTGTVGSTALELAVSFAYTPTGTAGADDNIYITGVQLEKGSTATSFDYRPYGTELMLCQRYFQIQAPALRWAIYAAASTSFETDTTIPIMRAVPTISGQSYTSYGGTLTVTGSTSSSIRYEVATGSAAGGRYGAYSLGYSLSAEL